MNRFKDLNVWQKAMVLTTEVYRMTEKFPQSEKIRSDITN